MDNFEEAIKPYAKKIIVDGLPTYEVIYNRTTEIYNRRGTQVKRPRYNEPQMKVKGTGTAARPVVTPLGRFASMGEAARAHGTDTPTMWRWVNDRRKQEFNYDKGA